MPMVLAIIPAKAASTRLPRKNILPVGGIPMLGRVLRALDEAGVCDRIIVSTEDEEIADIAREYGGEVPFMRPAEMARDPYRIQDVCLHVLEELGQSGETYDILLVITPTFPFLLGEDVRQAMKVFQGANKPVLLSVSPFPHPIQRAVTKFDDTIARPLWQQDMEKATSAFDEAYYCNGAIAIVDIPWFMETRSMDAETFAVFKHPLIRSVDVDTPEDYELAQVMHAGLLRRGHIPF